MSYRDPIYDHLADLTIKKRPWNPLDTERVSSYEPFRITKLISASSFCIQYAEEANLFKNVSKEYHYNYFLSVLPKRSIYFQFPKAKKPNEEAIYYIAKYFECGRKEATRLLKTAPKEVLEKILKMYDKSIKLD